MKRIILTYGAIAGIIVTAMLFTSIPMMDRGWLNYDSGMLFGYASMVLAFSVIFVAIRSYRDQHNGGTITFAGGLNIGLLIAVVAGVIYALSWEAYYSLIGTDFMEKWQAHYLENQVKSGATPEQLDKARTDLAEWAELYKNPIVRFGATLTEILPVGLIISLVAAGLLRKKKDPAVAES